MKLKLFIKFCFTLGILSVVPCLHAQTVASTPTSSVSSANTFGLGLQFGEPFGLTAKYFINDTVAFDGAFGWSPDDHSSAEIHADVLFHDFDMITPRSGKMPVYIGAGLVGRFRTENHGNLGGFRFPVGVSYMFDAAPIDVFGEVSPELFFSPFTRGGISAAAGIRFWF